MEIDTGAAYSLMSETTYCEIWPDRAGRKQCEIVREALEILGSMVT